MKFEKFKEEFGGSKEEFEQLNEVFNRLKEKSVQISVKVLRNIGETLKKEGFSL